MSVLLTVTMPDITILATSMVKWLLILGGEKPCIWTCSDKEQLLKVPKLQPEGLVLVLDGLLSDG